MNSKGISVAGLGLAAAIIVGAPAVAQASTGHHASCPTHCTPAPTPPKGGWPCQRTKSCRPPKHPHCRPPKKHHKPPVTKPPAAKPPHSRHVRPVEKPGTPAPAARVRLVADTTPTSVPQLAYTGIDVTTPLLIAGGLVGTGAVLISLVVLTEPSRRFNRAVK